MKKVGLYFGSFNPIHVGHVVIAQYMASFSDLDEVWMVVSPHNPFKKKANLLDERARFHLAQLAVEKHPNIRVSDVEFDLPQPSFTADTLAHLREKHSDHAFCLIMGSDNLIHFPKWKNAEYLMKEFPVYVYPRPGFPIDDSIKERLEVHEINAPLMELSSSFIRKALKEGHDVSAMIPDSAWHEIDLMNYFR